MHDLQVGSDLFDEASGHADRAVTAQFLAAADAREYLQALAEVCLR